MINRYISLFSIYNDYRTLRSKSSGFYKKRIYLKQLLIFTLSVFFRNIIKKILQIIQPKIGNNRVTIVIPYSSVETLVEIKFYNRKYSIPLETEKLLSMRYGDWKTHKKNYTYWIEDKTIFKDKICPVCGCQTEGCSFGGYKCKSCNFKMF